MEILEHLEMMELQEMMVVVELQEMMVMMEHLAHLELQVVAVNQEHLAHLVNLALLVVTGVNQILVVVLLVEQSLVQLIRSLMDHNKEAQATFESFIN